MKKMLMVVLALLSACSPIGGQPLLAQSSQDRCNSEVVPLLQQARYDVERYAPMFGCWRDSSGNWFMPSVDATAGEENYRSLTPDGRAILEAVDRMSIDDDFVSSVRFERSRSIAIILGPGWVEDEIDISSASLGVSSAQNWMNNYKDSYEESIMKYGTRTREAELGLAHYLVWYITERDMVLSSVSSGMNPLARTGYMDVWGYQRAPWPWQLANPYTIQLFVESDYFRENVQLPDQTAPHSSDSYLTIALSPNTVAARPGETVRFEIQYTRLQGVTEAAFMASAQGAVIVNLPLSQVDLTGKLACSPGHEGDAVHPSQRAQQLRPDTPSPLPSYLDVEVPTDAPSGEQFSVCFELTGFSGPGDVLFSWNASATIVIQE